MAQPKYPEVNGQAVSYASIRFKVDGTEIVGVLSINYKETAEFGKVRGTSRKPIARTAPVGTYEGDIELLHKDWKALLPTLTKNATIGYAEASHTISVAYSETSDPDATQTDTLVAVRFHSMERSNTEGTDVLKVKVMLDIMDIIHGSDGHRMISDKK